LRILSKFYRYTDGYKLRFLVLYAVEAAFIDSLMERGQMDLAKEHALRARYIDDLTTWGSAQTGGIMPPTSEEYGLGYGETTMVDGTLHYLGAKIEIVQDGVLRISVLDKHAEWKTLDVVKILHADSNNSK
jgi:hypothetical protein